MRDRNEIEREMFEARQDLEANMNELVHRAREKLAVGARAEHAVKQAVQHRLGLLVVAVASVIACGVAMTLLRRRLRSA